MANVKLLFYGTELSGTENMDLECFHNQHNEITIKIAESKKFSCGVISVDRETAIKLSKELRKQIALIQI